MIRIGMQKNEAKRAAYYLSKLDRRVTAFLRGAATHAARLIAMQVNQKLAPDVQPLAKEYKDGVRSLRVKDAAKIPTEEKGRRKKLTRINEEHWAAVAVRAMAKTGEELLNDDSVIIKLKPVRRRLERNDPLIPLLRYSPWTPQTIPFLPRPHMATLTYVRVRPSEVEKVRQANLRNLPKVTRWLKGIGLTIPKSEAKRMEHFKTVSLVEEVEYYALRREFGLVAGEKPLWKPAIKFMKRVGAQYLLKTNLQLWRSLFDPGYRGYGRLGMFHFLEKEYVAAFYSFQEKVR